MFARGHAGSGFVLHAGGQGSGQADDSVSYFLGVIDKRNRFMPVEVYTVTHIDRKLHN
jgi:hypothetical protein